MREYPIGFRVQRLNHSAITTWLHGTFVLTHQINEVKEVCSKEGKNCVVLFEHILRRIICILNRESRWRRENIHKNIFCGLTPPTKRETKGLITNKIPFTQTHFYEMMNSFYRSTNHYIYHPTLPDLRPMVLIGIMESTNHNF